MWMHARLRRAVDRPAGHVAYLAAAAGLGAVHWFATTYGQSWWTITAVVMVLLLGPTVIAAFVVLFAVSALVGIAATPVLAVATGIAAAAANVAILQHWARTTEQLRPADRRAALRRAVAAALFIASGCTFVALSFVAGMAALTSHGIGVRTPEAVVHRIEAVAAWTWWSGLVLAVSGLVAWRLAARRGVALVVPAAIEFVLLAGLLVTVTAFGYP